MMRPTCVSFLPFVVAAQVSLFPALDPALSQVSAQSLQQSLNPFTGSLQKFPTKSPTKVPTKVPTKAPTKTPTKIPTNRPTKNPTRVPTSPQTKAPTSSPQTKAPTKNPTKAPTTSQTKAPTTSQTKAPTKVPTKAPTTSQTKAPTKVPTKAPTTSQTKAPTKVPTKAPRNGSTTNGVLTTCEVDALINLLDSAVSSDHKLSAQWLRLAFHDAGTFNMAKGEGGANGCLMNDLSFRNEPENAFLDDPIDTLAAIRSDFEAFPSTCNSISAADIIQFAGLFTSLRQVPPLGIDKTKRNTLMQFEWGRPDESNCKTRWMANLPGFRVTDSDSEDNLPLRCMNAGGEIKKKMMDRNGFTGQESAALIGAHTIGLTRESFHVSNPWVKNGADDATSSGPVFDNRFHDFLVNTVAASTASRFSSNQKPFTTVFPDWVLDEDDNLSYLDTDITLAFPSQDENVHPSFHTFTRAFAADNEHFLRIFFRSLDKMGKLGVTEKLTPATACTSCNQ